MPLCKTCGERIDLSQPNIRVNICRRCKKTFCDLHFDKTKNLCNRCLGISAEEMEARKGYRFSFIRR
jgi:hypothetical protein